MEWDVDGAPGRGWLGRPDVMHLRLFASDAMGRVFPADKPSGPFLIPQRGRVMLSCRVVWASWRVVCFIGTLIEAGRVSPTSASPSVGGKVKQGEMLEET